MKTSRAVLAGWIALGLCPWGSLAQDRPWVESELPKIIELYKHVHQNPELSYQEEKTSARLAEELRQVGCEVTTGIGGYGVVGLLRNGPGKILMLRADMDALPVGEQTNLVYSSKVRVRLPDGSESGVMHACGHDVHMANLIGVARWAAAHRDQWRGTLMFLCQPAEERGGGAAAMLKDGLFERFPKPDYAVALHVSATLAAGKVSYRPGYMLANVDSVDIVVRGRGGHGAAPHTTIDPIVQAAQLVVDLQSIVSREIDPRQPAVITVGAIRGGSKHNIISETCELQLTVRSYDDEVRKHLLAAIRRKALGVAAAHRAPEPTIRVSEGTPALRNDEQLTQRLVPAWRRAVGEDNVLMEDPSMGGEDFSRYGLAGVPICMYRLGSVAQRRLDRFAELGQNPPSLHSPVYYPDIEPTLTTGLLSMIGVVRELLPAQK